MLSFHIKASFIRKRCCTREDNKKRKKKRTYKKGEREERLRKVHCDTCVKDVASATDRQSTENTVCTVCSGVMHNTLAEGHTSAHQAQHLCKPSSFAFTFTNFSQFDPSQAPNDL